MKTLPIILLCSLSLIGYGQELTQLEKKLTNEVWLYKHLATEHEKLIKQLEEKLATQEIIMDIKDKTIKALVKKCRDYREQDSIRLSNQFEIRFEYPIMILEEPYMIFPDTIINKDK